MLNWWEKITENQQSYGEVNMQMYATKYIEVCGLVLIDSTPEDYREIFLSTMSQDFQQAYNKQFV